MYPYAGTEVKQKQTSRYSYIENKSSKPCLICTVTPEKTTTTGQIETTSTSCRDQYVQKSLHLGVHVCFADSWHRVSPSAPTLYSDETALIGKIAPRENTVEVLHLFYALAGSLASLWEGDTGKDGTWSISSAPLSQVSCLLTRLGLCT